MEKPNINAAQRRLSLNKASMQLQSNRLGTSIASIHQDTKKTAVNLTDRVARIQNKINEIQVSHLLSRILDVVCMLQINISANKQGKAGEFQRKISQVENIFEEVLDNSKKKFDQTDAQVSIQLFVLSI